MKKKILACLVVSVVTALAVAYALLPSETIEISGLHIKAELLTHTPEEYFFIEEPDHYLLAALEDPGHWVYVDNETELAFPREEHGSPPNILKYNEEFYEIVAIYITLGIEEDSK